MHHAITQNYLRAAKAERLLTIAWEVFSLLTATQSTRNRLSVKRKAQRILGCGVLWVGLYVVLVSAGCSGSDSPVDVARRFVRAARSGDRELVYRMASPRSQQALEREAIRASELGGRRRTFRPQDFIEVSVGPLSDEPTDYQLVRSESEQAVVAVISGDGKRDLIELVRADGKWRVELDASKGQPSVRDAQ